MSRRWEGKEGSRRKKDGKVDRRGEEKVRRKKTRGN